MKMSTIPADTTPDAALAQLRIYRRMSGEDGMRLAFEMGRAVRKKVAAAVRERHPEYDETLVRYAEFRRFLGDELFEAVFPTAKVPSNGECCDSLRSMYS